MIKVEKNNMKKVIVITGGSDGLGKTLTESLSKENEVIILAINEEKMIKVANNNNCNYKVCDVSNYFQVEQCINEIIKKYGKIDVLINNAGLWIQEELDTNDSKRINGNMCSASQKNISICSRSYSNYRYICNTDNSGLVQ